MALPRSASPPALRPAGFGASGLNPRLETLAWLAGRLRNPSLRMAAAAGVVTHLPGLLYLLGLDAIADGNPPLAEGLLAVLVFDAIWLAIPFCGLIASIRRPDAARVAIGQTSTWMMSHERVGLTLVFAVVGGYFAIKGAVNLVR